jgi:hypothetical protein
MIRSLRFGRWLLECLLLLEGAYVLYTCMIQRQASSQDLWQQSPLFR